MKSKFTLLLSICLSIFVKAGFGQDPFVSSINYKTPASSPTNASTLVYTVTFSESVTGVDALDFDLTVSGVTGVITTCIGSGATYDVTITPVSGSGTLRLDLNSSGTGIVDGSSNPISGGYSSGQVYNIDNVAPTVSSINRKTPASTNTNSTTLVYTITFSESVSGVDVLDFVLITTGGATGTIDNVSSASGTSIDVTVTPVSSNGGTVRLDLNSSGTAIVDGSSNPINGGYSSGQVYTVDNVATSVTSINRKAPATSPTNATTLVYTVTFSESVSGVDIGDFQLATTGGASGTIASVSSASGVLIDVTINSVAGTGTIRLDLKSSGTGIVDAGSNPISGGFSTGQVYSVDHTDPIVSSIIYKTPASSPTNASSLVYTVAFSENVTGIDISDFQLTTTASASGTIASVSSASGTSIDVTINSVTGNGTIRLDKKTGTGISDDAGNTIGNSAYTSGQIYTIDNADPTVVLSDDHADAEVLDADIVRITATFTDANNIDVATPPTITISTIVSNAPMIQTSNKIWYYDWDVPSGNDGIVNVSISAKDIAGNTNAGPTGQTTYTIDNIAPVAPVITGTSPTNDATPRWDWSSGGGGNGTYRYKLDNSDLTSGANTTTSENYTSGSLTEGSHILYVQERDDAGNWSLSGSLLIEIDLTTQTPILTNPATNATTNSSILVNFNLPEKAKTATVLIRFNCTTNTYSDRVVKFKPSLEGAGAHTLILNGEDLPYNLDGVTPNPDVLLVQGGASGLKLFNGESYEVTIEYEDELGNDAAISIPSTGFKYLVAPPTLSYVSIFSNNNNSTRVGVGGKIFISFNASTELQAGTVVVKIANQTAPVTGSGKVWNASYTMQGSDNEGVTPFFTINFKDLANNSGDQVSTATDGTSVTFDRTSPILSSISVVSNNTPSTSARTGSTINISFVANETVEGVVIKLNGTVVPAVQAPANTYTANYIMTGSETEGLIYVTIDCKDLSGNSAVQVVNNAITFDKTNPGLSFVNIKSNNTTNTAYAKGTEVVTLTFTSNEDIKSPAVTFNSLPATTVTGGPRNWVATYTLLGTETQSAIPFSIPIVDLAGNTSTSTSTTDLSSLTIDRTPPSVTPANVTVPAGNYGIGSVLIITIPTDDNSYIGQNATVNGQTASIVYSGSNTFKVYYTVQAAHNNYSGNTLPVNVDLIDKAGNITNIITANVVGGSLLIINLKPTVRITGSTTKCNYPWQKVPITFTFTGAKPYSLSYRFTASGGAITNVGPLPVSNDTYLIDGVNGGTYSLISLTDNNYVGPENLQTAALENATINVNPLPSLTFDVTASPYSLTQPGDNLSNYVNLTPASFWGNGVGPNGYFYPSLAGSGPSTVYYSHADINGCKDTISYNIIVGTGAYLTGFDSQYCKNIWAKTDTIEVTNVIWGPSITDENYAIPTCATGWSVLAGQHKVVLDPKNMVPGTHTLTYSYKESGVPKSASSTFKVYQVSFNLDLNTLLSDKYCRNSANIELLADNHLPVGGVSHFTGPVTGFSPPSSGSHKAVFSPSSAPLGSSTISYFYFFAPSISSPADGCSSDTISKTVIVNPLPSPDFTVLKANYNYDEAPVLLTGVPANDLSFFTSDLTEATGVEGQALLNPTRAFKFGEDIGVTYSYTDKTTGCTETKFQKTKVYRATTTIKEIGTSTVDFKNVYCYRDTILTVSCIPIINGIPKTGVFSSLKNGISILSPNTAEYSLKKAGEGLDILSFSYDIDGTAYKIEKTVFIDSIGDVFLNLHSNFCKNGVPVTVQPTHRNISGQNIFTYDGIASAFISNPLFATFSPQSENVGAYNIKYSFTSDKGCSNSITYPINIRPIPNVDFDIVAECGSVGINAEIEFNNTTNSNSSTIANWLWDWADGTTSTLEQPGTHKFAIAGSREIKLTATTNYNCVVTAAKPITAGVSPIADFTWDNDCRSLDSINFVDKSLYGTFVQWTWKLDNIASPKNTSTIKFKLPEIKQYNVELTVKTNTGCIVSVNKAIVIQPYVKFLDLSGSPYSDDFETDNLNWCRKDNIFTSWTYGIPSGDIFSTSSSNTKAWYTNVGLANHKVENSQIVSSCFDLTGLIKPMVKFSYWSAPEAGRDGAVLQYSTNGGLTWTGNVGEPNKGVNWYETYDIRSQPAGQPYGWSSSDAQTGWKTARFTLDNLKNLSNVRFRVVYANKAENNKPFNGFAFDNFWIGERQQSILGEYFTNTTSVADNSYLKSIEKSKKDDIIPIHYHNNDGLYDGYTEGPSSRKFYYGISQIPSIYANGTIFSNLTDKVNFESKADAATLVDPKISISTPVVLNGEVIMEFKALTNIVGENLVLYCALVKDSIQVNNAGVYYYNVLRRFIPSPGGIALSTGTWNIGDVINRSISLSSITNSGEFINSKMVVFVQNSRTNEIYQVKSIQTSVLTSVRQMDLSNLVDVYPNPTHDYLNIECEHSIDRLMLFDLAGRVIGTYTPAQTRYSLPVQDLQNGIYILKGITKKGEFIRKFVKQ